jgi:hypothetical protein
MSSMLQTYKLCSSYKDVGYVRTWKRAEENSAPKVRFQTLFERPDKYRFEWCHSKAWYLPDEQIIDAIWRDSDQRHYCSVPLKSQQTDIDHPEVYDSIQLGQSLNSSETAVVTVLPMLFQDDRSEALRRTFFRENIEFVSIESIEEEECFCIQGSKRCLNDTMIWVSTSDYSLKRCRTNIAMTQKRTDFGRRAGGPSSVSVLKIKLWELRRKVSKLWRKVTNHPQTEGDDIKDGAWVIMTSPPPSFWKIEEVNLDKSEDEFRDIFFEKIEFNQPIKEDFSSRLMT